MYSDDTVVNKNRNLIAVRANPASCIQTTQPLIKNREITGGAVSEASDTLRRARRPGRADRTSARGRARPGRPVPTGPWADVSNEGTARSAAWRLPEAGIVKGLASPLTRTPAAELLKLPAAWRAEPAQSLTCRAVNPPAGGPRSAPVRAANKSHLLHSQPPAGGPRSAPVRAANTSRLPRSQPPHRAEPRSAPIRAANLIRLPSRQKKTGLSPR